MHDTHAVKQGRGVVHSRAQNGSACMCTFFEDGICALGVIVLHCHSNGTNINSYTMGKGGGWEKDAMQLQLWETKRI